MTINPWRGEIGIHLDRADHILRPTFESISRIEQELGTGFIALARKISAGNITAMEIAVIIESCMVDGGQLPRDAINDAIIRNGLGKTLVPIARLCTNVLEGFCDDT